MPLDPVADRRPPITPQLALRVAGFGVVAFVLFGIVFFRLWYLQVLDGDKYLAQARENRIRTERIAAPRGPILDRNNLVMVDNRRATVVAIDPRSIPAGMRTAIAAWGQQMTARSKRPKGHQGPRPPMPQPDPATLTLFRRLGNVLEMSPKTINQRVVSSLVQVPYADIRVRTDVPAPQRDYLAENKERFPGVTVEQVFLRSYPYKKTAAQVIGTIGEISERELQEKRFKGVSQGTDVGQNGLEAAYDQYLRGREGLYKIEVNAAGERRRAVTARAPRPGRALKLTLDLGLQQAGERALASIGAGRPGAFVAMNPDTGAVYAMGSYPSYNPRDLAGPFSSQKAYEAKFGEAAGAPLIDRADQSVYPTGSTFKPITSIAALDSGVTTPGEVFNDTGCLRIGALASDVACNAKHEVNGPVNLIGALRVSSDTYFYEMGLRMNRKLPAQPLQRWARRLGLGHPTGIDVPGESGGLVPDPAWRDRQNRREAACRRKTHHPCGLADGTNRPWTPGDETHLAVGQGDLQATPLQMAVAYSTIVNGGRVPTPHVGDQIEDDRGMIEPLDAPSRRRVKIDPAWRAAIMQGLHEAANAPGGTSTQVFDGWPRNRYPIFGKTGTAERPPHPDQSWYIAYSYDSQRPGQDPIVIACTIENAGFGAQFAAPAVRLMLSHWFSVKPKVVQGGAPAL